MLQKFEHEDLFNLNTGLGCTKASMTSHVDFFGGLSSCTLILLLFTYPLEKHRKTMDNMFFFVQWTWPIGSAKMSKTA